MREIILRSRDAKMLLSSGKPEEYPTFLKTIGSNFLLKGNALRWGAAPRVGCYCKSHYISGLVGTKGLEPSTSRSPNRAL